jgi:hypothetical protein
MNMSSSTTTPRPFFIHGLLIGTMGLIIATVWLVFPLAVAIQADGVHRAYFDMGTFALRSSVAVITLRFPPTSDSFPVAILSAIAGKCISIRPYVKASHDDLQNQVEFQLWWYWSCNPRHLTWTLPSPQQEACCLLEASPSRWCLRLAALGPPSTS